MALTTVADVEKMLRWSDAEKTKYSAQLPAYVAAASEIIEAECGPFEARTITHTAHGASAIVLPTRVNAVLSVEVNGSAVTDWTVDGDAGILYGPFSAGRANVVIEYTVGGPIPDAVKLAATMVAVDKWAIASQRVPGFDDGNPDPSYLMPKAVRDLLSPFYRMPGFA